MLLKTRQQASDGKKSNSTQEEYQTAQLAEDTNRQQKTQRIFIFWLSDNKNMSIVHDIKFLHIQGAKRIATEALHYLKDYSKEHGFGREFDEECAKLLKARPTAVALHNVIQELKHEKSEKKIDELLKELHESTRLIAQHGSKLIHKGWVIQTHCHSSEAMGIIEACKSKHISVIAHETEPKEQGIITVKELARKKIPVTLIIDSAAGFFMKDTDCLIVGADALREEGVVNKIGTYLSALAAAEYGKPIYVAASRFKIDKRPKIEIEERPTIEVYHELKGVKIRNPAFDITPWKYVTAVVTESGVKKTKDILRAIKNGD